MENNFLGMGNPLAPETFVEPVANQAERDGMPRLVNMLQEFLKPVLSATIGRFFTGFDSDQKAPEVPTFLAEKGAEEAASVAELVMSPPVPDFPAGELVEVCWVEWVSALAPA